MRFEQSWLKPDMGIDMGCLNMADNQQSETFAVAMSLINVVCHLGVSIMELLKNNTNPETFRFIKLGDKEIQPSTWTIFYLLWRALAFDQGAVLNSFIKRP